MEICSALNCDKVAVYEYPYTHCWLHYLNRKSDGKAGRGEFYHHGGSRTPEYRSWSGMKRRCYDKNNPKYGRYGGRGITVCERWLGRDGFPNFLADIGKRPSPGYSLDRIDNDGDYELSNCRWATPHQQNGNRSISQKVPGVTFDRNPLARNKWNARYYFDGELAFYGRYPTEHEAILMRKAAEKWYSKITKRNSLKTQKIMLPLA